MNSPIVLTLLVSLCVVAAITESKYEVFTKQQLIEKLLQPNSNYQGRGAINSKYRYREDCNSSMIPPDDGSPSYGDLIYTKAINESDTEVYTGIFVNEVSNEEQIVFWSTLVKHKCVSHVKALNFGRQRAFTKSLYVTNKRYEGGLIHINLLIPADEHIRMIFEVTGREMYAYTECNYAE